MRFSRNAQERNHKLTDERIDAKTQNGAAKMKSMPKEPEARRHHYVPQCWLAGFTDSGEKDGMLWVTDLGRKKQWQASPNNAGHIRDFYRLSDEQLDPVMIEKAFSKIEGEVAPILRTLDQELRAPGVEEFSVLLPFIALQWARVPAFRPLVFNVLDSVAREKLAQELKSEETWKRALKKAGIAEDAPGAAYESMMEFYRDGRFSVNVQTEWYVQQTFKAAEHILPTLAGRSWRVAISPSGGFIGSDNPVVLDGPKNEMRGFKNAEIIMYVLSKHVVIYSTHKPEPAAFVNRKYIAHLNRLLLLRAEQVFSNVADFCWLDEHNKYQTDWRLFSKDKMLAAVTS